jgi:hypothetical protein
MNEGDWLCMGGVGLLAVVVIGWAMPTPNLDVNKKHFNLYEVAILVAISYAVVGILNGTLLWAYRVWSG